MRPVGILERLARRAWPALAICVLALPVLAQDGAAAAPDRRQIAAELFAVSQTALEVGTFEGTPPAAEVRENGRTVGYIVSSWDAIQSVGYSGKPIHVLVGIDKDAVIRSTRLLEHHEPIVLVGIPESKVVTLIEGYVGLNVV